MIVHGLVVNIERGEDGRFFASCPELQGCFTEGETEVEARELIKDAILLHVEDRLANGEPIPDRISLDQIQ